MCKYGNHSFLDILLQTLCPNGKPLLRRTMRQTVIGCTLVQLLAIKTLTLWAIKENPERGATFTVMSPSSPHDGALVCFVPTGLRRSEITELLCLVAHV